MEYSKSHPFYRLLEAKYDPEKEDLSLEVLRDNPEVAVLEWRGPDDKGQPFVKGSTALHYAANDGKTRLVLKLIEAGADVNASNANWYRSVLSWAANNACCETIRILLDHGADPNSLHATHAAAFGGSRRGKGQESAYYEALKILHKASADINDTREPHRRTPLAVAVQIGNQGAIDYLTEAGARPD